MNFKQKLNEAFDDLDWSMAFLRNPDQFEEDFRMHVRNNPNDAIDLVFMMDGLGKTDDEKRNVLRRLKYLNDRWPTHLTVTIKGNDKQKDVNVEPNVFASGVKYDDLRNRI